MRKSWLTVCAIVVARCSHLILLRLSIVKFSFHQIKFGSWISPWITFDGDRNWLGLLHIGDHARIEPGVTVKFQCNGNGGSYLKIGSHVFIGRDSVIDVFFPVEIGKDTMIGSRCYIVSQNHGFRDINVPMREQPMEGRPIVIENNVWLGSHVIVLSGAKIGSGSIIAAGSVVTNVIPPNEIWGGVPAKFIRSRS